jgi:hypothetical protein
VSRKSAAANLHRRGLRITARAVESQLAAVPDRTFLERQRASLAWKIGYRAAALVLPRPALTIVSAAVKAVRALERGGMELGR